MALIKCEDCDKEFSDKADSCPNCGCPNQVKVLETTENIETKVDVDLDAHHYQPGEKEYLNNSWWARTPLLITKSTGVIGQVIIGTLLLVFVNFLIDPSTQSGKDIIGYSSYFPFLYINKYSSTLNKILVFGIYLLLIASGVYGF
jgi:hypothetical protein